MLFIIRSPKNVPFVEEQTQTRVITVIGHDLWTRAWKVTGSGMSQWGWQYHYETWSNKHLGRMTPLAGTEHWWLNAWGKGERSSMNWSGNISWRRWISLVENVRQFNVKVKMSILHLNCHFQHSSFPYGLRYFDTMILSSFYESSTFTPRMSWKS